MTDSAPRTSDAGEILDQDHALYLRIGHTGIVGLDDAIPEGDDNISFIQIILAKPDGVSLPEGAMPVSICIVI